MKNTLDIILVLTEKELKSKYKRSFLGYVWSILSPLFMGFVIYIAFSELMRFKIDNYPFYLLSGLFLWQWINVSVNNSLYVYIHNATIIKKTNFNRKFMNIALLNSETIHFIASLPILLMIFLISNSAVGLGFKIYEILIILPFSLFILTLTYIFLLGFSLIISSVNVIFRDMERVAGMLLQILFYTSPIVYPRDLPPEKYRFIIEINPITHIVEAWRSLFLGGINFQEITILFILSIITFMIGYLVHEYLKYKIVEYL